jgi:hypothetical protein
MEFVPLSGYEDRYEISREGVIRKISTKRPIKQHIDRDGYLVVYPWDGERTTTLGVHRALALTYIPIVNGKNTVNHIDGHKQNNSLENLEWANAFDQMRHARDTLGWSRRERNHAYVPIDEDLVLQLLDEGFSQQKVGDIVGVSQASISRIKHGTRFKHVI